MLENEPLGIEQTLNECLVELDSLQDMPIEIKSYYQLVLIESVLKLYQTNNNDKYAFLKSLVQLLPYNCDLLKLFLNFVNVKKEFNSNIVQYLYDHLVVYSIQNDYLWILFVLFFILFYTVHVAIFELTFFFLFLFLIDKVYQTMY
jgi:hypothetical protein